MCILSHVGWETVLEYAEKGTMDQASVQAARLDNFNEWVSQGMTFSMAERSNIASRYH